MGGPPQVCDVDGSGDLDFEEFVALLKTKGHPKGPPAANGEFPTPPAGPAPGLPGEP